VPEVQIKNIYPDIPEADLNCLPEPAVPVNLSTEVMADLWTNQVVDAGADCRSKLTTIRDLVHSWPTKGN
jgi:hypothetical protein